MSVWVESKNMIFGGRYEKDPCVFVKRDMCDASRKYRSVYQPELDIWAVRQTLLMILYFNDYFLWYFIYYTFLSSSQMIDIALVFIIIKIIFNFVRFTFFSFYRISILFIFFVLEASF